MADAKIVRVPASGVAGTTELDANLDGAVLIEDSAGLDFLEVDTANERVILGGGGAHVHIGEPTFSRTLSVDGEFRVEADPGGATNDFFTVLNVSGAGSNGILGISQGDIAFRLKSSGANFGIANDSATHLAVFQDGKITTGGETTSLGSGAGSLHLKTGDSAADSSDVHADADDLLVEGSGNTGISILTPTNKKGCLYFVDASTGGTPDGIVFDQGTGSMRFQVANSERVRIDNSGQVGIGTLGDATAMLDVKGDRASSLSGTFTATNGDATLSSGSSTAFTTQLVAGSAIEIFEGTTSRGVFTVSSITSATELELDSTMSGLSSSSVAGLTAKTDSDLLKVQTGDSQTAFKMPKPGRLEVLQASSLKHTNLIIGDSTTGEDITTGFQNIFIGCGAGKENTINAGTICIGHESGSFGISQDGGVYIGFKNRGASGGKTVAVGRDAGSESGGQLSVCVGFRAGRVSAAGHSAYFGQYSTMLGANTRPSANNDENSIAVGYDVTGHGANTAVIGNSSVTQIDPSSDRGCNLGQVSFEFDAVHCVSVTEVSDERLKEQIEDTTLGVDFIKRLRPVSYKFKDRAAEYETGTQTIRNENGEEVEEPVQILKQPALTHTRKHQGLIAQEVKQVLDDIGMDSADFGGYVDGNISGNGDRYALRYQQFISPLIKAVQELTARIEVLENGD